MVFCYYLFKFVDFLIVSWEFHRGVKFWQSMSKFSKYFSKVVTQAIGIPILCSKINFDRIQTDGFLLLFVQIRWVSDCVLRIPSRHEIFTIHVKIFKIFLKSGHTGDRNSNSLLEDQLRSNPNWLFFVAICSNSLSFWLCLENSIEAWKFWFPK